jgi:hypothetical protein
MTKKHIKIRDSERQSGRDTEGWKTEIQKDNRERETANIQRTTNIPSLKAKSKDININKELQRNGKIIKQRWKDI